MLKESVSQVSGIWNSNLALLGCILVVLKLAEVLNWDWYIVLFPFYLPVAIVVGFAVAMIALAVLGFFVALSVWAVVAVVEKIYEKVTS